MSKGISIKFPFEETTEDGVFATTKTTESAIGCDLISLLTLKKGQRPMQGGMYSPIYEYINEPLDDLMQSELSKDIQDKVETYLPQINIKQINFTPNYDKNLLGIKIIFNVKETFGTEQTINLNIPLENQSLMA